MRRLTGVLAASTGLALVLFGGLPAQAAEDEASDLTGLEYVSLGDSYQAGFGLTPFSSTSPFTGDPNGCFQADANYPHGVAAALGLTLDDQTCSGAITANIGYGSATVPATTANVILPTLPTVSEQQTTMTGMLAPQVQSAALSASTDVVTVGIGGNDLGFSSIAEACIRASLGTDPLYLFYEVGSFTNCEDYFDDESQYPTAYLTGRLASVVQPRLAATFAQIRAAAPNAQVFVVGYPQIAPADATDACFTSIDNTDAVPFSGADIRFIHDVESGLVDLIQSEAAAHEFHFISTWDQTSAHTLCSADPWIAGLTAYLNPFSSTCDSGYIPGDSGDWVCIKLGALHPNEGGVTEIESIVQQSLADTLRITASPADPKPGGQLTVTGGGFAPNESVELRIESDPVVVGTATADGYGAISTAVTVPAATPAGDHTLIGQGATSGRSFSTPLAVAAASTPTPTPSPTVTGAPAGTDDAAMLPESGVNATVPVLLGVGLLAVGSLLMVAGGRTRRS